MSGGCYRCGLSEGSADRLCETCYRLRFHQGRDVIDLPPGVPLEGLEFSPKVRAIILSCGAVLYMTLVGFVVAVHATTQVRTVGDSRLEMVSVGQEQSVVRMSQSLGAVKVPRS